MNWNDLTMSQRAEIIGMAIKGGITNIDDIRKYYNSFDDGGTMNIVSSVNSRSKADFVERAKDPNRKWLLDWDKPNTKVTHKLSYATNDKGEAVVFPLVQNLWNNNLHDFTNPRYKHGKWDALDSAIQRGDTLKMTPKEAQLYTENYKNYYPNFKYRSGGYLYQKGGGLKGGKNRGDAAGTKECAEWSNGLLRENGYLISGNAWGLNHVDMLFNGFDGLEKPSSYDRSKIEVYNHNAAGNVYNNFDSKTLDKSKPYVVNMYYNGSPRQEKAYNEGRGVTGTHTGILTHDGKQWNVTHNIDNKIHEEPFISLQSGNNKYGVTAIYEPRKDNILNRIKGFFGFEEGGYLKPKYFAGGGILEDEDKEQSPITNSYMRTYNPSYNRPLKRVDSNWTDGLSGVGNLMQTIPHPLTQGIGTALTIPDLVVDLNNLEHSIRQGEGEQIYSDAMSVVRDYPLSLSNLTKGTKGITKVLGKLDDIVPLFGYGEDVLNTVSDTFDYWDKWTYNKGKELLFGNKKEK